jgi:hypothetical protein
VAWTFAYLDARERSRVADELALVHEQLAGTARGAPVLVQRHGALFLANSSNNNIERQAAWGESDYAIDVFGPSECWALSRNRPQLIAASSRHIRSTASRSLVVSAA